MSIYSNDNIRKIAKLTTRELPQKSKNAKITVRENNGLYSRWVDGKRWRWVGWMEREIGWMEREIGWIDKSMFRWVGGWSDK